MSLDNKHKELLDKLISGTISDHEQWQLERASLDDPFLADALEGYHLHKTTEDDLAMIKKKLGGSSPSIVTKTRSLLWKRISIAASLLVLFSASFWMFKQNETMDMMSTAESAQKTAVQIKTNSSPPRTIDAGVESDIRDEIPEDAFTNTGGGTTTKAPAGENNFKSATKEQIAQTTKQAEIANEAKTTAPPAITEPSSSFLKDEIVYEEETLIKETDIEEMKAPIQEEELVKAETTTKTAEKKAKVGAAKSKSKRTVEVAASPQEDLIIQPNMSLEVSTIPTLTQGVVLNNEGKPMPGVEILDLEKNQLGVTDVSGNFFLPEMNGYVITAFAGYDSMTVALTPNLSIQLQESSRSLSQPLKRLVDMMDEGELRNYYINELNVLFSKNWPICSRSNGYNLDQSTSSSRPLKNNTTVHIVISDNGKIFDTTFYDELDEQCAPKITDLLLAAESAELFVAGRPLSFTYRINF